MFLLSGTDETEPYAARRYRKGLRSYRRAIRRPYLLVFGFPLLASLAGGLYLQEITGFFAGCIFGACAIVGVVLWDEPPAYLQTWRDGAEGERRTHKEIARLGWHVVEDVDTGHGNYDHIVVGSSGVYLLETKNLTGIVEIRDGEAWLRRRHDPEGDRRLNLRPQVLGGSAAVCDEIERRCGHREWVNGVVVFWSAFPHEVVETDKITYVHGSKLRTWLSSQPDRLDRSTVASIAGALAALKVEGDIGAEQREARRREA
jgi:hypothetical protein